MKCNSKKLKNQINLENCIVCQRSGGNLMGKGKSRNTLANNLTKIWSLDSGIVDINCESFDRFPDGKLDFGPPKPVINKMRSACEHRLEMAEKVFSNKIMDVPQSLAKTSVSEFHGKKSEITKNFIESSLSCLQLLLIP